MSLLENIVEEILEHDPVVSKIFLGAFARDELPIKPSYPSCFIINTDPRRSAGEHWLAIYYNSNGYSDFFDSYGHSPSYFNLEEYLDRTSNGWTFSKKCIQGSSEYCGYYSILFLLFKARNKEMSFFKAFTDRPSHNDSLITKLINENM